MAKVKKKRIRCSDCGKILGGIGEASQKCSYPPNQELDLGHTVRAEEYFEMEGEGEYGGDNPMGKGEIK